MCLGFASFAGRVNHYYISIFTQQIRHFIKEINETITEDGNDTALRIDGEGCRIIPTYEDLMYRTPNTLEIYKGEVLIDNYTEVIYPSYGNDSGEFLNDLWVYDQYDGLILENNWPLDMSEKQINETALYLPYFSEVIFISRLMTYYSFIFCFS